MAGRTVDTSDLRELAADLRDRYPEELNRHVYSTVKKSAQKVKDAMVEEFKASEHFDQVARTIGYDITGTNLFGTGIIAADVGPDTSRGGVGQLRTSRSSANDFDFTTSAAPLAHIAWYGGADGRGGSDKVTPPEQLAAAEAPHFEAALDELISEVFR